MTPQSLSAYEQLLRRCKFTTVQDDPYLITGSWDWKVKSQDFRSQNPVATTDHQDRVYTMDIKNKLLVISRADCYIKESCGDASNSAH